MHAKPVHRRSCKASHVHDNTWYPCAVKGVHDEHATALGYIRWYDGEQAHHCGHMLCDECGKY